MATDQFEEFTLGAGLCEDGQLEVTLHNLLLSLDTAQIWWKSGRNKGLAGGQNVAVTATETEAAETVCRVDIRPLVYPLLPVLPRFLPIDPAMLFRAIEPLYRQQTALRLVVRDLVFDGDDRHGIVAAPDIHTLNDRILGWISRQRPEWVQALADGDFPGADGTPPLVWFDAQRERLDDATRTGWAEIATRHVSDRLPILNTIVDQVRAGKLQDVAKLVDTPYYGKPAVVVDIEKDQSRLWIVQTLSDQKIRDLVFAVKAPDPQAAERKRGSRKWHPLLVRSQRYPALNRAFRASGFATPEWIDPSESHLDRFLDTILVPATASHARTSRRTA